MAARIADTADKKVVVLQRGSLEAVDVLLFRSSKHWDVVFGLVRMVVVELRVCRGRRGRLVVCGLVLRV